MGAGKVALHDIHCVAKIDKSTPFLFHATATGKHFATGTITCRKAGGSQEKFYVLELKDILVSGFQFGGSTQSDIVPMVQFSLSPQIPDRTPVQSGKVWVRTKVRNRTAATLAPQEKAI